MKSILFLAILFLGILTSCTESKSVTNENQHQPSVKLKITNSTWVASVSKSNRTMVGHVNLVIKGKTNAEKLTVLTYGDGVRGEMPVKLGIDGKFNDTIGISFVYFGTTQPDYSRIFYSKTIVKAYLNSDEIDTTLNSGPLQYRDK
jgi:hypothetical protein